MKKLTFTIIAAFAFINGSFAQADWTTVSGVMSNTNTGYVGIGTTTPSSTLEVFSSTTNTARGLVLKQGDTSGNTNSSRLFFANSSDIATNSFGIYKNGNYLLFTHSANPGSASGTSTLAISNTGTVGINTSNTYGYTFGVNGSAIATSMTVKVYSSWADYVFKKGYRLPLLSELKSYINQNQHLPGIPSARQVAKDGINLGEMNGILVKKVEELTLYLIDKDEQIKAEEQKVKEQDQKLNEQQLQLSAQQAQIDQLNKAFDELSKKLNAKN